MIASKEDYLKYVKADSIAMFGTDKVRIKPFVGMTYKYIRTLRRCEYYTNVGGCCMRY